MVKIGWFTGAAVSLTCLCVAPPAPADEGSEALTNQKFADTVAHIDKAEVKLAQLALDKSGDPDVKKFAKPDDPGPRADRQKAERHHDSAESTDAPDGWMPSTRRFMTGCLAFRATTSTALMLRPW